MRGWAAAVLAFIALSPVTAAGQGSLVCGANQLHWTQPATDLAGFEILLAPTSPVTEATPGVVIRDVGSLGVPITGGQDAEIRIDALAQANGPTYVCVRAYNAVGKSPCSNELALYIASGQLRQQVLYRPAVLERIIPADRPTADYRWPWD